NDTRVTIDEDDNGKSLEIASQRWNSWIKFFINAVVNQANKNIDLIEKIDGLYNFKIAEGKELINSNRLIDIFNVIFERPIFTKKTILERVDMPSSTLGIYLNKLEEKQIIYSDGKSRNKKYYFYDLINILRQQ
ncbi:MAG: Fic family protein, partial [Clostridium sp.]